MSNSAPVRVVLIDRDPKLLSRLDQELSGAGMQVETLSSTLGLTPELLALSAPDVLLLDAGLPGLPLDVIPVIFTDLRRRRPVRCMVVVDGAREEVAMIAAHLKADSGVPRESLIQAGARALKEQSTPPARPPAEADPRVDVPSTRPQPAPRLTMRGLAASPPADILGLIEDELARGGGSGGHAEDPAEVSFHADLDLFSEHTVFVGRSGAIESGGLFIATSLPPPTGTQVTLEFTVFRKVRAAVVGKVLWIRTRSMVGGKLPTGCGVSIETALDEAVQRALKRFMEERQPLTYIAPKPT